jgi:hypothetical protein
MMDLSPRAFALLRKLLLATGVAFTVLVLGYGLSRPGNDWRSFWLLYVLPMVVAAPLWLRIRLADVTRWPWRARILDAIVVALSVIRFFWPNHFPFSGHTFFLSYSMITTRRPWWLLVAGLLLVETTVFKLSLWDDAASWLTGLAIGVVAGVIYLAMMSRDRVLADQ